MSSDDRSMALMTYQGLEGMLNEDQKSSASQDRVPDIAISVRGLCKSYHIYDKPHDRLKQSLYPRIRRVIGAADRQYYREFCALKDVSFDVRRGETVGIIGRNGSGKSTLLQMICGTLAPTSGEVLVKGRVAALLELGAGFNPEFTGRENIYMNASILGLKKEEIDEKYDDIVAFADIGSFIDQPVKTYSSGMYVRLAFAVIVHVDADILIVDEALAVGDAFFTQKCMMQIKKLMASGVTLLFVSHDANAVKALCSSAVLLKNGEIQRVGETSEVVEAYYGNSVETQQTLSNYEKIPDTATPPHDFLSVQVSAEFSSRASFQRLQNGKAEFVNVQLLRLDGTEARHVQFGEVVVLRMVMTSRQDLPTIGLAYHVRDKNGFDLVYSDTGIEKAAIKDIHAGDVYCVDWKFKVTLRSGEYTIASMLSVPIDLSVGQVDVCDFVPISTQFSVVRGDELPLYGAVHWENDVKVSKLVAS